MAREGIIYGSFHTYVGEEAIATAVAAHLRKGDAVASTHRGNGHFIAWGADLKRMFAECLGKGNGYCKGKGGKMHLAMTEPGLISANGIVRQGFPQNRLAHLRCAIDNVISAFRRWCCRQCLPRV